MNETQAKTSILEEIKSLRNEFETKFKENQAQKSAFDQLYGEMQQYKDNFVAQTEKPLLLDLLLFYDSLNWFQESLIKQDMSPDVLEENFQYLIDELLELLYRRNVVPMESSEQFQREHHKAKQVVHTDNPNLDQHITQVLKRGFVHHGNTLRPEEVIVARYKGES